MGLGHSFAKSFKQVPTSRKRAIAHLLKLLIVAVLYNDLWIQEVFSQMQQLSNYVGDNYKLYILFDLILRSLPADEHITPAIAEVPL